MSPRNYDWIKMEEKFLDVSLKDELQKVLDNLSMP